MSVELEEKMLPEQHTVTFASPSGKKGLWIAVVALAVLLAVSFAAMLALAIALGVEKADSGDSESQTTGSQCPTPECAQLAAQVLSGLDESVNPCENFYNFSCGNWARNTIIPDGEGMPTRLL